MICGWVNYTFNNSFNQLTHMPKRNKLEFDSITGVNTASHS